MTDWKLRLERNTVLIGTPTFSLFQDTWTAMPARCNRSRNCTVSENCQLVPFSFLLSSSFVLSVVWQFLECFATRWYLECGAAWRELARHITGRFLERERERERPEPLVRSIKICACATSLQQACTLFLTAIKEMRPSPATLVPSFFVAIGGKGLDQNSYFESPSRYIRA